ncbi:hypothetical protein [Nostoc sp.]|uniref:hypothetical protein n=1 Tax=Nostoc sp. TaxID=1180 RepID=UPI002FF7F8B3
MDSMVWLTNRQLGLLGCNFGWRYISPYHQFGWNLEKGKGTNVTSVAIAVAIF